MPMAPSAHPSRVLEITIISAQDLAPISRTMKTYAIAWVDPERKLTTRVDQNGLTDPTWNDKFVFRLDENLLCAEDTAVEIEIYAAAWVKDALVGQVKVLIADLFTLRPDPESKVNNAAMRIISLHVRRPSGRIQGILTLGVALLDSTMRALPIYDSYSSKDGSSAVISEIVGVEERINKKLQPGNPTKLRRSQSDKTDLTTEELEVREPEEAEGNNSTVNGGMESACNGDSTVNGGSEVSSDVGPSASVVAAAIAKGLYRPPATKNATKADGLSKHLQEERRRRSELSPRAPSSKKSRRRRGEGSRRRREKDGSFTCFGNVFGCEISISCGGRRKKKSNAGNKVCNLNSVDDIDTDIQ